MQPSLSTHRRVRWEMVSRERPGWEQERHRSVVERPRRWREWAVDSKARTRRVLARRVSRRVSSRVRWRAVGYLRAAPDRVREEGGVARGVRVRGPALPAVQRRIEAARAELLQRLQPLPEVRLPHVQHKLADNSHRHRALDWRKGDRDDVRALRVLPEALRYHSETPPAPSTVVVERRVVFVWWVRWRVVERRRRRGVELAHRPGQHCQQRRERARASPARAERVPPSRNRVASRPLRAGCGRRVGALGRRCAHAQNHASLRQLVAVAR